MAPMPTEQDLKDALIRIYDDLLKNGKQLDPEIRKIINDNLWDLYLKWKSNLDLALI